MIEKETVSEESDQLAFNVPLKKRRILSMPGVYKWKTNLLRKYKNVSDVKLNVRELHKKGPSNDMSKQKLLTPQVESFKAGKPKLGYNEVNWEMNLLLYKQQKVAKKQKKSYNTRHSKRKIENISNSVQSLCAETNISPSAKEEFNIVMSETNVFVTSKNSKPLHRRSSLTEDKDKTSLKRKRCVHKSNKEEMKKELLGSSQEIIESNNFSYPTSLKSSLSSVLFSEISKDCDSLETNALQLPILDGFEKSDLNKEECRQCFLSPSQENKVITTEEVYKLPTMNVTQQGLLGDKNCLSESVSGCVHSIMETASVDKRDLCPGENLHFSIGDRIGIKECATLKEAKISVSNDKSMSISSRSISKTHMAVNSFYMRNMNFRDDVENKSQGGQLFDQKFTNAGIKKNAQSENDNVKCLKRSYNTKSNVIIDENSLQHQSDYSEANSSNTVSSNLLFKPIDSDKTVGDENMPLVRDRPPHQNSVCVANKSQNDDAKCLKRSYNAKSNVIINENSLQHKSDYLEANSSNTVSSNLIFKPIDSDKTLGDENMPLVRGDQPPLQKSVYVADKIMDLNGILYLLDDASVIIEKRVKTNNFNCVRCRKGFMNLSVYCNHFRNCDIGSKDTNIFLDNIEWMCLLCSGIFKSYNGLAAHRPCPKLSDTLKHPFPKQDTNSPSDLNKVQGIESIVSEAHPLQISTSSIKKNLQYSNTDSNQHVQKQSSSTSIECIQKEHPQNDVSTHNYSKYKTAAVHGPFPYEQQCNDKVDESPRKKHKQRNLVSDGQSLELQEDKSNVSSSENLNESQKGVFSVEMDIIGDLKSPKVPVKDESSSSLWENATISDLKSIISNLKVELDSSRHKSFANIPNSSGNVSHKEDMLPKEEEGGDSACCKSLPCQKSSNQFEKCCPCYHCASNSKVKHEPIDDATLDMVPFKKSEKPAVCSYPEICQFTPSFPYINSNLNSYVFLQSCGMFDEKKKIVLNEYHHKSIDATYDCCMKKFLNLDRKLTKKNLSKVGRSCFIPENQTSADDTEFSPRIISVVSKSEAIYYGEALTNNPIHNHHPSNVVNQEHLDRTVATTADRALPTRAVAGGSSSTNKYVPSYFHKKRSSHREPASQKGIKLPHLELKFTEDLSVSHNFYEKKNPGGTESSYICAICFSNVEKKEEIPMHYFKNHDSSGIRKTCYVLPL